MAQAISRSSGRNEIGGSGNSLSNVSFLNLSSLNTTMITASSATFQSINSYAMDIVQLSGYSLQGPLDGNFQQAQNLFMSNMDIKTSTLSGCIINNTLIGTTLAVAATFMDLYTYGNHVWAGPTTASTYNPTTGSLAIDQNVQAGSIWLGTTGPLGNQSSEITTIGTTRLLIGSTDVTLSAANDVTLSAANDLTLSAANDLTLSATDDISVVANDTLTLSATTSTTLTSNQFELISPDYRWTGQGLTWLGSTGHIAMTTGLAIDTPTLTIPNTVNMGSLLFTPPTSSFPYTTIGSTQPIQIETSGTLDLVASSVDLPSVSVYRWYPYNDTLENNGVWTSGVQKWLPSGLGSTGCPVFGWCRDADVGLETTLHVEVTEDVRTEQQKGFFLDQVYLVFDVLDYPFDSISVSLHRVDHATQTAVSTQMVWGEAVGSFVPQSYRRSLSLPSGTVWKVGVTESVSLQVTLLTQTSARIVWYGCQIRWTKKGW